MSGPVVTLSIDGRRLEATAGTPLLEIARRAGIEIPTLCDHPALEPSGACRLCMVEVTHPDWKGWSGLMTACLYPAAAGLEVQTDSPRARQARRQVLTLLAARCPSSPEIAALAARYGATTDGLSVDPNADRCILCGLCTRVCESYATAAITTFSRGSTKQVGPFAGRPPQDCVGCGACAALCPTGHIEARPRGSHYEIWGRSFDAAVCSVDEERCFGCGACEEGCPFAVPRVQLRRGGNQRARIAAEQCRGCGACVGACPTGAIDQAAPYRSADLRTSIFETDPCRLAIVACPRCGLTAAGLPEGARIIELPCTGRVSLPLLLLLAARHDGVLVLGRHPETCRLGGAEAQAKERCNRAGTLLELLGLGSARVRFALAETEPHRVIDSFLEELRPSPLLHGRPSAFEAEGLDEGMSLLAWMADEVEPAPTDGEGPTFNAAELPYLELLAGSQLRPLAVDKLIEQALEVLQALGVRRARVVTGPVGRRHRSLSRWLVTEGRRLPRPPQPSMIACHNSSLALVEALGYTPLARGPDLLSLLPESRHVEDLLAAAERQGALALLVDSPQALVLYSLLARQGRWRSSRLRPVLAHQLAWASLRGLALTDPQVMS